MKRVLLSILGWLMISTLAISQISQQDYIMVADQSTVTKWLGWDNNYGDGGLVTVSLSSDNAIKLNFNLPNPGWYPFIGTYWFNPIDASVHPKIIAKVKLPAATTGFGLELKCVTADGTDTLGLNGAASTNSLPRIDAFAGTGEWQYFEYAIGTWESGYPTPNVPLDPSKVVALNFFYSYNAATTPVIGEMECKWIALAKDGITASALNDFLSSTGVSEMKSGIDFNVYPNPSYDGNFEVSARSIIRNIEVYNTIGQKVYVKTDINNNKTTVSLKDLTKGLYILKCNNASNKIIIK
jgi:hypothetical protein